MSLSGRARRRKGIDFEREVVGVLRQAGLDVRRVPLSGGLEGDSGDIQVELLGRKPLILEAKRRARGLNVVNEAMGPGVAGVVLRADRGPRYYVLSEQTFLAMLRGDLAACVHGPDAIAGP